MTVFFWHLSICACQTSEIVLHWDFDISIWIAAGIVMIYTFLADLPAQYIRGAAIFLIVLGLSPLVIVGLGRGRLVEYQITTQPE